MIRFNVFDTKTLQPGSHRPAPAVSFDRQGKILFNKAAASVIRSIRKEKGKGNDDFKDAFFQDQDHPTDWYLSANNPDGYPVRVLKSGACSIIHRQLAGKILASLSASGSAKIPLCEIPEVINGEILLTLETKRALIKSLDEGK